MALPQQLRRAACALHMYFLLSRACCLAVGGSLTERAHTDSPANSSRDSAHRDLNGQGPQVVVFGDSLSDVGEINRMRMVRACHLRLELAQCTPPPNPWPRTASTPWPG